MDANEYAEKRYTDSFDSITRGAYENLGNEIILPAVHDYVDYAVRIQRMRQQNARCDYHQVTLGHYQQELARIKRFFFSQWFRVLTHVEPSIIWEQTKIKTRQAMKQMRYDEELEMQKEAINHESKETQRKGHKGTQQFDNAYRTRGCVPA